MALGGGDVGWLLVGMDFFVGDGDENVLECPEIG